MDKLKLRGLATFWNILAIVLIFLGFGMIHGSPNIEKMGSIMIGLGSLYLIMIIARSFGNKDKKSTAN